MTGLRERKRVAAMVQIQRTALDLFADRGYAEVSVAEIAAAANVAERTVYRYFGTKEMLVAYDPRDIAAIDTMVALAAEHGLLEAARRTVADLPDVAATAADGRRAMTQLRLLTAEPALAAAFAMVGHTLGDALGSRTAAARGLPADDLASRAQARALIAALTAAVEDWYARDGSTDLRALLVAALDAVGRLGQVPHGRAS
ncbi:TetR family transcriptional regulator [Cellulomonas sp. McL0617]|uniref:TetR family transcriptional regulator n=1 Tax=Cellulomonas sp. McL0617 TaxID=3415675 RepID=UPI003CF8B074